MKNIHRTDESISTFNQVVLNTVLHVRSHVHLPGSKSSSVFLAAMFVVQVIYIAMFVVQVIYIEPDAPAHLV